MPRFTKANRDSAATAHELLAALGLLAMLGTVIAGFSSGLGLEFSMPNILLIGAGSGFHFLVAKGLSKGSAWAPPSSIALSVLMLFSPPFGTPAGIYVLYSLFKKGPAN
jgi:hypothetical protein